MTNRVSFKSSFFNEKKSKRLSLNGKKEKNYYDKIPRIPQYAFIHNATQSILQEFFSLKISHANSVMFINRQYLKKIVVFQVIRFLFILQIFI